MGLRNWAAVGGGEGGEEVSGRGGRVLTQILNIYANNCGVKLKDFEELFQKTTEMPHVMSVLEMLLRKPH